MTNLTGVQSVISCPVKDLSLRPQEEKLPGGATDGYAGVSRHSPQVKPAACGGSPRCADWRGEPAHGGGSPSGASGVGFPPSKLRGQGERAFRGFCTDARIIIN
ncbi:MAG: hypothetical protein KME32_18370 [Mojavia pulchra JT2-VF2]|uniref:Uncharacterized protein n=1 Tax=Mojavia pulchra JT2-VF2 TaxID=287848 RepID=A0A951UH30_9NOST|nr:hypothetical protein [Mojavia pulchra JT2-VF2]